MSSTFSLVALSLGTRDEVAAPAGGLADSTSLWMAAFSDSSLPTV